MDNHTIAMILGIIIVALLPLIAVGRMLGRKATSQAANDIASKALKGATNNTPKLTGGGLGSATQNTPKLTGSTTISSTTPKVTDSVSTTASTSASRATGTGSSTNSKSASKPTGNVSNANNKSTPTATGNSLGKGSTLVQSIFAPKKLSLGAMIKCRAEKDAPTEKKEVTMTGAEEVTVTLTSSGWLNITAKEHVKFQLSPGLYRTSSPDDKRHLSLKFAVPNVLGQRATVSIKLILINNSPVIVVSACAAPIPPAPPASTTAAAEA